METKEIFKRYESLKAFNNYLERGTTQKGFHESSEHGSERFTGTASYKEAAERFLKGDSDLQKKIEAAGVSQTRINVQKKAARRQVFSSVVGAIPNVPAYISGAPNSMIAQRMVKTRKKVFTIGYSMTATGSTKKELILKTSANLLSAILIIESSGVRVNLHSLFCSKMDKSLIGMALKIKSAAFKLDTLRMAYPLAHPSFLRRQCFRWTETTEGIPVCYADGYGYVPSGDVQRDFFNRHGMEFDTVVTFEGLSGKTVAEIVEIIKEAAK